MAIGYMAKISGVEFGDGSTVDFKHPYPIRWPDGVRLNEVYRYQEKKLLMEPTDMVNAPGNETNAAPRPIKCLNDMAGRTVKHVHILSSQCVCADRVR